MAARILVIEDNPTNLTLMGYLLKAFGHTVLTAIDGEQGLEAVRSEVPDLIICDVQIPKLDGYEVAKQLKNHPTLCKIPLIAVTALAMVGDREKILAAGFDGYIPKPIDPEAFVPEVEALLHSTNSSHHHPVPPLAVQSPTRPINPATATILVVDNSTVNLSLMQITLEPCGYHVICAYDAEEALKADPQLRAIPFAFISSTLWPEKDREIGLALGAVKFIVRPIGLRALLAAIEDCLQR